MLSSKCIYFLPVPIGWHTVIKVVHCTLWLPQLVFSQTPKIFEPALDPTVQQFQGSTTMYISKLYIHTDLLRYAPSKWLKVCCWKSSWFMAWKKKSAGKFSEMHRPDFYLRWIFELLIRKCSPTALWMGQTSLKPVANFTDANHSGLERSFQASTVDTCVFWLLPFPSSPKWSFRIVFCEQISVFFPINNIGFTYIA